MPGLRQGRPLCFLARRKGKEGAAALGGLDVLVFTAGIGENDAATRASICEGMEWLGIKLDPEKNKLRGKERVISAADSKVQVWVIPTDEELMIAQDTAELAKR